MDKYDIEVKSGNKLRAKQKILCLYASAEI